MYKLREASWIPESGADRALYQLLLSASDKQLYAQLDALRAALPIASLQASITFNGRINRLAFGNERPLLVVGSNKRRVGVWDLQEGRMMSVCSALSRSVGAVEVLEDGRIIAAERTNAPYNDCHLYLINGSQATVIGTCRGSFTGLQALSGSQFATAGRDGAVTLWDANSRSAISSQQLVDWPRSLHADESGRRLIAVHRDVAIIDSQVQSVSFDSWLPGRVPSAACTGPGTDDIVIGFHTGPARVFAASAGALRERARLDDHHSAVTDMRSDVKRGHVFVGHAGGNIAVYAWPARTLVKVIDTGAPITSLSLARSGDFLATGHAWDRATIWDLRSSSIPSLFTRPMISTTPSDLGAVVAFSANVELPPGPRQLLDVMAAILRHRFRHDVELDDLVRVKAGRYDIAID